MSQFIQYPFYADDVPVDLSFVYASEKPAGKHGFLKVKNGDFVFEDGTPGRFWGTNFNGGANFPSFEYSETVAKRLAKIGCNIVRLHQLDAEWDTPNIYSVSKGKRINTTRELDGESLKRLDYLIYCLKQEGIYIYIDILTYRRWKLADGVANADKFERDNHYAYYLFDPRMIELQKEFAYDIYNHYNPYTGLKYKDDPVFVMGEVINEADMFNRPITVEPYVTQFREIFKKWLAKKHIKYREDPDTCDINAATSELFACKSEIQQKYFKEMIKFLHEECEVKFPLTGTNWTTNNASTKAHTVCDFTDSHSYFYDWNWDQQRAKQDALDEVENPETLGLARMTLDGKPFFCSEWDVPWPNHFRGESPILYAAIGSLQRWAGWTIHTYSYGTRLADMKLLGKEISSTAIGGTTYREGIFSTWNDPAKFGLFYHAALICRRQDVAPSKTTKLIKLEPDPEKTAALGKLGSTNDGGLNKPGVRTPEALRAFTTQEYCGIRCTFDERKNAVPEWEDWFDVSKKEVKSDNGQLYRSWKKRYGYIDTERTKCVYGQLRKNGEIKLNGLSVKSDTDYAVIALSSLTDAPLDKTDNILLTAVGKAQNTGAKFEGDKMLELGTAPVLIEVTEATVKLKTEHGEHMRVWAINAEGFYYGMLDTEYKDGYLTFKLGSKWPSMYYLIVKE